jgi:hypothetical protein
MKIGLINVDSKIPNLALMKISGYFKARNHQVEWFKPLYASSFDKVFASKIFTFTPDYGYYPVNVIKGGSGYDLNKVLHRDVEHQFPDYTLYDMDYAMGYLTRGCYNKCPFCIVPQKEGRLHKHADLDEFWDEQNKIMLLDNSLTDFIEAESLLTQIKDLGLRLNLSQGFNVRTIQPKIAKILSEIKLWPTKQWHIAWDNINEKDKVLKGIRTLNNAGIKNWKIMCYVLVGFNTSQKQDLHRINLLEKLGVDPFVMTYVKNKYTRTLSKWCNRKPIFKTNPDFLQYTKLLKNYGVKDNG